MGRPGGPSHLRGRRRKGALGLCLAAATALTLLGLPQPHGARAAPARPFDLHERVAAKGLPACRHVEGARCGSLRVPFDREDPSLGKIRIGFELYRRTDKSRPSLGTMVAVEGGPGYSTTASRSYYLELFRPLLKRRRLLLVDNRGTGRSGAIHCEPLQSYEGDYVKAVGKCGRQLGEASDLYGSGAAADDLAAILDDLDIERVDLYGDSYGTFFSQAFAVRHPERLRSVVLDAAYFVGGTDPFYVDTNRALRDAFTVSCERSPACEGRKGTTMRRITRLAEHLRGEPIMGRAQDADGVERRVKVDVGGLIYLVTSAATSPTLYRELDAAARAVLQDEPYERPLLRLARETYYVGGAGPVRQYSEGLYVAVACNDYPQAYDIASPPDDRPAQYQSTLDDLEQSQPDAFAPFTIDEWVTSPVEYYDSCLKWPVPSRHDGPVPPGATFPDTPVLVLAGDLDSLTSPEGARQTADAFPNSTYVEVANMTHVSALSDFDRCASVIVRRFVRKLEAGDTSCAARYNEIRLVERFVRQARDLDWGGRRTTTARIAAATVGDVIARWFSMLTYAGVGLRGGSFTTTDGPLVTWKLDEVRWVKGVRVSGKVRWDRSNGRIRATVTVAGGAAAPGELELRWNDRRPLATARATGTLAGRPVDLEFPAP